METFKHNQISIMLSKSLVGKAPPTWEPSNWARYYKSFRLTNLTPRQLAAMVYSGYAFTPPYANGRRKEENFTTAYHMAFDFDGEGAALDFLMREGTFAWMFSSFAYSTPSSTAEHPKSRVVFVIPDGINDAASFRTLYQAIAKRFEEEGSYTDPSCKDPLRLYYGSYQCQMVGNWSALFPPVMDWIVSEYPQETKQTVIDNTVITLPADDNTIDHRVSKEVDRIRTAVDGEKHNKRVKAAFTVGGYVGAGHLSMFDAESRLIPVARANSTTPDQAENDIRDCLARGAAMPLPIEITIKKDVRDLL